MPEELVETYGGTWDCPVADCPFVFRFELCLSEDEGKAILMQVSRLHGRFQHGSETYFEVTIFTVEARGYQAAGRRPLDN